VPRPAEARASVRETLDACTAAICDYVTRACAVEDPARPGSDALLSRLLAALESVPRVHERARKPAAEDEGDAGEEGDEDGERDGELEVVRRAGAAVRGALAAGGLDRAEANDGA
jgi:hypothetical protein